MVAESHSTEEQIRRWVAGEPTHHRFGQGPDSYECCPDFSCCKPHLLAPDEIRKAYESATTAERHRWLGHFLAAFLADVNVKTYLVGSGGG